MVTEVDTTSVGNIIIITWIRRSQKDWSGWCGWTKSEYQPTAWTHSIPDPEGQITVSMELEEVASTGKYWGREELKQPLISEEDMALILSRVDTNTIYLVGGVMKWCRAALPPHVH